MLFFFKEKPIEIVALVSERFNFVREFFPIKHARDAIPPWWKNTPVNNFSWDNFSLQNNVRTCPGIIHTITSGLIMPLWSDLAIQVNHEEYRYQFSDGVSELKIHQDFQSPGFYSDFFKLKTLSPWILKTPVKVLYMNPFYHMPEPCDYIIPHGIVTPIGKDNLAATNHFLFIQKQKEGIKNIMIKKNTPLFHILPLTDKKIKIRLETASPFEFTKLKSVLASSSSFVGHGIKNITMTKGVE